MEIQLHLDTCVFPLKNDHLVVTSFLENMKKEVLD